MEDVYDMFPSGPAVAKVWIGRFSVSVQALCDVAGAQEWWWPAVLESSVGINVALSEYRLLMASVEDGSAFGKGGRLDDCFNLLGSALADSVRARATLAKERYRSGPLRRDEDLWWRAAERAALPINVHLGVILNDSMAFDLSAPVTLAWADRCWGLKSGDVIERWEFRSSASSGHEVLAETKCTLMNVLAWLSRPDGRDLVLSVRRGKTLAPDGLPKKRLSVMMRWQDVKLAEAERGRARPLVMTWTRTVALAF